MFFNFSVRVLINFMIFKFYFDTHNILHCYNVSHNVILILFCYLHSYCYIVISYLFVRIVLLYFITINYIHSIIIIIIIISLTHLIFFLPNNSLIHYKKGSKKRISMKYCEPSLGVLLILSCCYNDIKNLLHLLIIIY